MAKEKIRCVKCRKNFDPDLYSGLCPKCGAYNGRKMNDAALEHYVSTAGQGEKEHRELHEKYDRSYEDAHPDHGSQSRTDRRRSEKSPLQKLVRAMFMTVAVMAVLVIAVYLATTVSYRKQAESSFPEVLSPQAPGYVVFDHVMLHSPIEVRVHSAGIAEEIEELEGKSIYVISVGGGSSAYNYDTSLENIYLRYECEGNVFYERPLDSYSLLDFCRKYEIWEEEVFSGYELSSETYEEGYLIFITDTDACDHRLLLQLTRDEAPAVILQEAEICLDELPAPEWNAEEDR